MNIADGANGSWKVGTKIWNVGFLSGYNLCIFIGIIVAFITVAYHWRRQKYSWENLQILMILIIPFSILGARFYTCIFDGGWENFFTFAGMSIYGGVIGAIIPAAIFLWFRRYSIDWRTALTIILPTVLIGQAIGRWGNFQNHELYGRVVSSGSLDWMTGLKGHMNIDAPIYNSAGIQIASHDAYRAPIFFYESMLDLGGYLLLVWVLNDRNYLKPGVTAGFYFVYYGIVRLILQVFRDANPLNTSYFGDSNVSVNLVVSSLAIIGGLFLAAWWQFRFKFTFKNGIKLGWFTVDKKLKFTGHSKIVLKGKEIFFGSSRRYDLIKPKKMVRRCWVGPKYERTFRIYIPIHDKDVKWSKRELNKGKRNGQKKSYNPFKKRA